MENITRNLQLINDLHTKLNDLKNDGLIHDYAVFFDGHHGDDAIINIEIINTGSDPIDYYPIGYSNRSILCFMAGISSIYMPVKNEPIHS